MVRAAAIDTAKRIFRLGLSVTDPATGETNISTKGTGLIVKQSFTTPALGAATAVHAAVTDTAVQVIVTTGITNPAVPRSITATAGGTAADVKAISVIIAGTDFNDQAITETLPAFTVNATGVVEGNKAFKTVTSITIPAHDGTGATTAIGTGAKLGLNRKYAKNTVILAYLGTTREATLPTMAVSSTVLSSNTVSLSSALDGSAVVIHLVAE